MRHECTYQGLVLIAEMSASDPGDWMTPPCPAECIDLSWEVDDIEVVLEFLGIDACGPERDHYEMEDELPLSVRSQINGWEFNMKEAAEEDYREQC